MTFLTALTTAGAVGIPGALILPLGREFGWDTAAISHQFGAGTAACGAGLSRTLAATYLPALYVAGVACLIAAVLVLAIRPTGRPQGAAAPAE